MSKELTTTQLQEEWEAMRPKPQNNTSYNYIFLENKKMSEDGTELNKNFGKFFAEKDGIKTEIDITKAQFFPTRHRFQVRTPQNKEGKSKYFCREADDLSWIQIFETEGKQLKEEGSFFDLRTIYDLKTKEVLYVFYEGDYYRWVLSAGSWQNVKHLTESIRKSLTPRNFKIKSVTETKSDAGFFYNVVEFDMADEIDLKDAVTHGKTIAEYLNGYYENVKKEKKEESIDEIIGEYNVPKIEKVPEISAEDLPF